jgi:hypothetical protein
MHVSQACAVVRALRALRQMLSITSWQLQKLNTESGAVICAMPAGANIVANEHGYAAPGISEEDKIAWPSP